MSNIKRRIRHGTKKSQSTRFATRQDKTRQTKERQGVSGFELGPELRVGTAVTHSSTSRHVVLPVEWSKLAKRLRMSGREIEIARLLCAGLKVSSMARQLGISVNTVTTHLKRLYKKCRVHDRATFVALILATAWVKSR